MSRYLVSRIEEAPNIDVGPCTEVLDAVGAEHNEQVLLGDASRGTRTWVPCGRLFLFIGALPHTGWLPAGVVRDDRGFILTGTDLLARHGGRAPAGWPSTRPPQALECGVPSLFAVGDVRATSVKRVAAAVGEGALAVSLVHQHLSGQP
jgi:thioredoxin reductase (NADPH)